VACETKELAITKSEEEMRVEERPYMKIRANLW